MEQKIQDLTRHAEWADATVWGALLESPETLFDDRVRFLLHHVHTVQRAFCCLWRGEELEFPEAASFANAQSLASWGREGHAMIRRYLEQASTSDLGSELAIPWAERLVERFGRSPGRVTVEESVMQVALHSLHHRGQVASHLRELGSEPPLVDFIAWLWLERPDPDWPGPA